MYGNILTHHHVTQTMSYQKDISIFGSETTLPERFDFKYTNNNKDILKIAFCDWWNDEYCGGVFDFNNNFITNILKYSGIKNIIIVNPENNPDILFYSIFGNIHKKYTNIRRIFYSGEPFPPRIDAHFNITFDKTSINNFRYPLWLSYINNYLLEECDRRKQGIINIPKRDKFCSFISNGEVKTTCRREIVEKLSKYKRVDCGGKYLNNIGYNVPKGVNCSGKIEHNLQYKFAIAFENENYDGYVSEKICDIYKSNCIPIYWGSKAVFDDFNPTTFIYANDFKNFDELVNYIIKVDNDEELYASYFKEPFFSNFWLDVFNDRHNTFYKNICDLIIGKNNLYNNYIKDKNIKIFNIWHNKLFDKCYEQLDVNSLNDIIMYDVNPKYNKIYNADKNYNIMREYELNIYDKTLQENNYCQTSCLYHIFINNLYKDLDYIGFIQYDMILDKDFIYDMIKIYLKIIYKLR
jgi:hypothetical protein